jgi:hypothetical protein
VKTKILKTFIAFSLIFGLIYGGGKIAVSTVSKNSIQKYLSKQIGAEVVIRGKLDFKILPKPHLEVSHLRISNLRRNIANLSIRAPVAKLYPDFISLLKFELVAKNVEFANSELNIDLIGLNSNDKYEHHELSEEIIFTDSSLLITNEKYNIEKRFKDLSLTISQLNKNYKINGSFTSNLNSYKIKSEFKNDEEQKIAIIANLNSDNNILSFNGFFDKNKLEFYGDSKVSGSSLQKFLFKYINRSPLFFPDGSNFDFKLDFDLKVDEHGVSSQEIVISSPSLNSNASFFLNTDGMGELNFDIKNVELGEILSREDKLRIQQELLKLGPDDQIFVQIPDSGIFKVNVKAENLNIFQHELSDVLANLEINGEDLTKKYKINFIHSGQNIFNVNGSIISDEQSNFGINGYLDSEGKNFEKLLNTFDLGLNVADKNYLRNYSLSTNFKLIDQVISLSEIDLKFDDTNLTGKINIFKNDENTNSEIKLNFDKINFDNYKLKDFANNTRNIFSFFYGKISEISDRRTLFQKFLWLRNINSKIKYSFNFDEFSANNQKDKNLTISGVVDHRFFSIDSFNIKSKTNNFQAKFIIDINDLNPRIDVNVDGILLNADFLDTNSLSNGWSQTYIRIPDFTDLPGTIKIDLKNLNYQDLTFQDLKVSTTILDNILYFDVFNGRIFQNGNFNIAGNFIVGDVPTLNIAFTAENLKLHKLSYQFFENDNFQTLANISGKISCFGQNTFMFFNSLKSEIRMITRAVTIKDYNIKNVIQYIADVSNYEENLPSFNLETMLKNGEITFSPLDLNLKINKGIFQIDNLTFNINDAQSIYSGIVNLPEQKFALNNVNVFRSYYRSGDELKDQMLRFDRKYQGNLFKPEYQIEDSQIENFVAILAKHSNSVIDRRNELRKEQEAKQKEFDEKLKKMQEEEARLQAIRDQEDLEKAKEEDNQYN